VDRTGGPQLALKQHQVIDSESGDSTTPRDGIRSGGGEQAARVRGPRGSPAPNREMRVKWTDLERQPAARDPRGHVKLQGRELLRTIRDTQPDNLRRTPRREHAETLARNRERRHQERFSELSRESGYAFLWDVTEERQRQMEPLWRDPFWAVASRPILIDDLRDSSLFLTDRAASGLVDVHRDKQAHSIIRASDAAD
jgi:hypothetical protein